jgi:hypothetical protein
MTFVPMTFVPSTAGRVPAHTAAHVNRQIERQIEASMAYFAEHRDEIDRRLEELDQEWEIERTLKANAASFSLLGLHARADVRLPLARPADRRHSLFAAARRSGLVPAGPGIRRLRVRTAGEIDRERYARRRSGATSTRWPRGAPAMRSRGRAMRSISCGRACTDLRCQQAQASRRHLPSPRLPEPRPCAVALGVARRAVSGGAPGSRIGPLLLPALAGQANRSPPDSSLPRIRPVAGLTGLPVFSDCGRTPGLWPSARARCRSARRSKVW